MDHAGTATGESDRAEPDAELDFEHWVVSRAPALLRYGYVLTGNPHDAADLVQEALIRLRASWSRVLRKKDPEGYVRTTMARHHISLWRRTRRETLTSAVPDAPHHDPAPPDDALWQSLATLPRRQRAVLVLRYYEALSDDEIAARLNITRGTVRSQASRALDKLRAAYTPHYEGSPR
ncbi:SigE family RNA polymerase sigma factor [Actinocorallia sp. API 0066]|uniref:SigE family RNA polymerase sigma factor n=1 Tax=Actinocorallia sp. API 0066 TaxID=2896846 RepID=UPI001E59064C|nr:SigE family RNA polymerase sigma factor [Actinocorallia sp. API 0066]MCD0447787.1 SigE family RNA polymerase sigma factor [Actinocorallia sp. API 0066]